MILWKGLQSIAAEWVIIVGMLIAGVNFGLLVQAVLGKPLRLWSSETKLYLNIIAVASIGIALNLFMQEPAYQQGNYHDLIRDGIFQVVSIITSSGLTRYDTIAASLQCLATSITMYHYCINAWRRLCWVDGWRH